MRHLALSGNKPPLSQATETRRSKTHGFLRVFLGFAIFSASFGPQYASAQSGSFAMGGGGFVYTPQGEQAIYNECEGLVENYGLASCQGATVLKGDWSNTQLNAYTETGTGGGGNLSIISAGAAATYNENGSGMTSTHCNIQEYGGVGSCASGAYASPDGAFVFVNSESVR